VNTAWFAAVAAATAVFALGQPGRMLAPPRSSAGRVRGESDRGLLRRLRGVLAVLALFGCVVMLGGLVGIVVGSAAGAWSWRVLGAGEGPVAKRRRRELEDDLPLAVHLLGACLRAGSAIGPALETVSAALPGAVADELMGIAARLDLGADPATVWAAVAQDSQLGPLGSALMRAHGSGASVVTVIDRLSADLRSGTRDRITARARTVEVRAAAPLGLCLLPAFLLLGVVPMTAGLFSSLSFLQ
jgi:Flp pilus assembly protein TadB